MKRNLERPWLTNSGVEIPTLELREISREWDMDAWRAYLKWYESSRREAIITPLTYLEICDGQVETIFESLAKSEAPAKRNLIERLLSNLPEREAEILRSTFLLGMTQVQIAAALGVTQQRIAQLKTNALSGLKRGLAGDKFVARRFMKGVSDSHLNTETSIWDEPMVPHPNEIEVCTSDNFSEQINNLKNQSMRVALLTLPTRAQQIAIFRFWRGHPPREISQKLALGMNLVDQVCDASATKVKQTLTQFQTGTKL